VSEFFIWASVLLLSALLLICLPWFLRSKKQQQDVLTNTRLIKLRLTELGVEQAQGLLTEEDRIQAEQELKLALLDEVKENKAASGQTAWMLALGLIIGLVVAGAVYFQVNQISQISHWQSSVTQLNALGKTINSGQDFNANDLQNFTLALRTKLHDKPNDAQGWMLLGTVWGALNQPNTAKEAFEKSLEIEPENIGTLLRYAQALTQLRSEDDLKHARRVLLRIIDLDPNNINATGTLAIVSSLLGDNQRALQYWLKLRNFLPKDDPNYAAVQQRIDEFQGLGQSNNQVAASQESNTAATKRVQLIIDISDELKSKLPANGVLFVFAQDPTGQVRMPAAVVKLPLGEFPLTVDLSDQNAMMPTYKLSSLTQAKLVARISLDDNVAQATGELQGEIIIELKADSLNKENILINKEIL
jgi:cytochrome c-type biogenesis protein CcmI